MATTKTGVFPADPKAPGASVEITLDAGKVDADGNPQVTAWSCTVAQALKHETQFKAGLSGADVTKFDTMKAGS